MPPVIGNTLCISIPGSDPEANLNRYLIPYLIFGRIGLTAFRA